LGTRKACEKHGPSIKMADLTEQAEQSATPDERAHLAACPFCQRIKAAYRRDQL
jgi:hypothetical protein